MVQRNRTRGYALAIISAIAFGIMPILAVFASAAGTFGLVSAATGQLVVPAPDARLPIVVIALACTVVGIRSAAPAAAQPPG